ncbi:MAG: PadR family transcriptional regulator [Streptomyces sp.]|nr:PadR family transcriptional regulator [Streptomyces sp.]
MTVRITRKVRRVIDAIHTLDHPWGLTICQETGLCSGTVYPILERLATAGWIGTRTEDSQHPDRPPRTFYHLTLRGQMNTGIGQADCSVRQGGE